MSSAEEYNERLVLNGRELGAHMLTNAVAHATSHAQVANQIVILQMAAIHILASIAMNAEANNGSDPVHLLESIFENVRGEYAFLKVELAEGRLEHVKTDKLTDPHMH